MYTNKINEIRIDVTKPFINALYLRHGVSIKHTTSSWLYIFPNYIANISSLELVRDAAGNPDGYIMVVEGYVNTEFYIARLSYNGTMLWCKQFRLPPAPDIFVYEGKITQTQDANGRPNGFILAGYKSYQGRINGEFCFDCMLMKLAPDGNMEWVKTYGTRVGYPVMATSAWGFSVLQTFNNAQLPTGYVVYGQIRDAQSMGIYVLTTDLNGDNPRASKYDGGSLAYGYWAGYIPHGYAVPRCMIYTHDNNNKIDGYLATGLWDTGGTHNYITMAYKFDKAGACQDKLFVN